MRWKLLRRRLSVSAPRVIVRSHLPWPLRWAVAALVLGFSGALALWAFEVGKDLAGLEAGFGPSRDEVAALRLEVSALRAERDRAQSIANAADSLLKAERAAQERLAQDLRAAQDRQQALEADLGFFERLLPANTGHPIQLRALHAESTVPGQTRYQLLVMQSGKAPPEFQGRYQITLIGTLDGRPWRLGLPDGEKPLSLRQYARIEGLIEHPPAAVLKSVQAQVVNPQGSVLATQTLKLP
jgi:hypothetical protein